MSEKSARVDLLDEASAITGAQRNLAYGEPGLNLSCAGRLKQVFREYAILAGARHILPGEQEAIDMVLTKLSRLATGAKPGRDTYLDAAAYMAIAFECSLDLQPPEVSP